MALYRWHCFLMQWRHDRGSATVRLRLKRTMRSVCSAIPIRPFVPQNVVILCPVFSIFSVSPPECCNASSITPGPPVAASEDVLPLLLSSHASPTFSSSAPSPAVAAPLGFRLSTIAWLLVLFSSKNLKHIIACSRIYGLLASKLQHARIISTPP